MFRFLSKIPFSDRSKIIASVLLFVLIAGGLFALIRSRAGLKELVITVPIASEKKASIEEPVAPKPAQKPAPKPAMKKPTPAPPKERFMKGFSYAGYGRDVFASKASDASIRRLAKTGTNWISIVPIWYQKDWRATQIAPAGYSPSDASLNHLFNYARKYKMKIVLKPFVDSQDDTWRALYQPKNVNHWFASYRKFIIHYAKIAQKKRIPILCIGTELTSGEKYANKWRAIIRDVRKVYKGKLTYAADYHDITGKSGGMLGGGYLNVRFWKDLDYIGVDAYFPLTYKNNPTVPELVNGWKRWIKQMAGISKRYNKKVVITEIEYLSANGTNSNPGAYKYDRTLDLKEQADCYEATLRVLPKQKWLAGMLWWRWDNPSTSDWGGGPKNDNCTPKGKPAEKVLSKWFHRIP